MSRQLTKKQGSSGLLTWPAASAKSLQPCPTLCDPIDGSQPGSPDSEILQARTLEWVAISFSNAWKSKVKVVAQSCPTLRDPTDCSLPGSSVHGIFQARVLEWGAIAFSLEETKFQKVIDKPRSNYLMLLPSIFCTHPPLGYSQKVELFTSLPVPGLCPVPTWLKQISIVAYL